MFVIDAKSATAPRAVMYQGWSRPVMTIEPTTAMAEIAFVIDISGVCSRRDTRVTTPRPMNVASMNTNTIEARSGVAGACAASAAAGCAAASTARVPVTVEPPVAGAILPRR